MRMWTKLRMGKYTNCMQVPVLIQAYLRSVQLFGYLKNCRLWSRLVSLKRLLLQIGMIWSFIIHQIFSLARDWSKHVTWPNILQLKLGNVREYSPIFKTARVAKKDLKDNKHDSLHLGRKYARIFVLGHSSQFSSQATTLSENCSLLETGNIRGQIS